VAEPQMNWLATATKQLAAAAAALLIYLKQQQQ
jgi:hypothetical protein